MKQTETFIHYQNIDFIIKIHNIINRKTPKILERIINNNNIFLALSGFNRVNSMN